MMMTLNTGNAIKIELVHKASLLHLLQQLCVQENDFGFTTMEVQSGSGPLEGFYFPDVTDAQYYSFVLLPEERLTWFLKVLKKNLTHEKCLIFTSPVTKIQL
jgi:hypothetical protein